MPLELSNEDIKLIYQTFVKVDQMLDRLVLVEQAIKEHDKRLNMIWGGIGLISVLVAMLGIWFKAIK